MERKQTGLVKSNASTCHLATISKASDLLQCINIQNQIKTNGREQVLIEIRLSIEKCIDSLGMKMSDSQVVTLCNDIVDTYYSDSIEDVREAIKKGRRGVYGMGFNSRSTLTMLTVREWMEGHLLEKAIEREKKHQEKKKKIPDEKVIDYQLYMARQRIEAKERNQIKQGSEDYRKFKNKWLQDKQKLTIKKKNSESENQSTTKENGSET